jgi:hypothetical protein
MGGEYHAIIAIARPALLARHSCKPERPQPDHILCPREPSNGAVGGYIERRAALARKTKRAPTMFSFGERRGCGFELRSLGRRSDAALRRGLRARPPPDPKQRGTDTSKLEKN